MYANIVELFSPDGHFRGRWRKALESAAARAYDACSNVDLVEREAGVQAFAFLRELGFPFGTTAYRLILHEPTVQVVKILKHFNGESGIFKVSFVDKASLVANPNATKRSSDIVVKMELSDGMFGLRKMLLDANEDKVNWQFLDELSVAR